jgi:hypothetical protein
MVEIETAWGAAAVRAEKLKPLGSHSLPIVVLMAGMRTVSLGRGSGAAVGARQTWGDPDVLTVLSAGLTFDPRKL